MSPPLYRYSLPFLYPYSVFVIFCYVLNRVECFFSTENLIQYSYAILVALMRSFVHIRHTIYPSDAVTNAAKHKKY